MAQAEERARVVAVAREWIGTPFHDVAGLKGIGVDCAHLVERVYAEAGVMEPLPIEFYPPQWFLHRDEELFIAHILRRGHEVDPVQVGPGDMAIFKMGRCFAHGAIIASWPEEVIHAWAPARCVLSSRLADCGLADRAVRFFSLW